MPPASGCRSSGNVNRTGQKQGRKGTRKQGRRIGSVSRYAAALHSLTVIPRTALLPLYTVQRGRRSQARTVTIFKTINHRL
ncbi:hypothetical protein M123_4898 [Bacteroides fragilis str. 3976T8]|uniref:Uncharacterized protein n=1 Tax=Bacteroides fragilis str. 3976T8 TaxID=1339314 RepID=A0A016C4C0_BACFG|nr:hypothetical protein M123_4898 [Bacteroides fragilis str. 3976T8]